MPADSLDAMLLGVKSVDFLGHSFAHHPLRNDINRFKPRSRVDAKVNPYKRLVETCSGLTKCQLV